MSDIILSLRMRLFFFLICFLPSLLLVQNATAQHTQIKGWIKDTLNKPVPGATIRLENLSRGTSSDENGYFQLSDIPVNQDLVLYIRSINHQEKQLTLRLKQGEIREVTIILEAAVQKLNEVKVTTRNDQRMQVSVVQIKPQDVKTLPSTFGDFNKILATLPGVVSNNELSSTYSVRGGNYDENLIYVNNIEVYRPFLARSGQQEGLSFVNPDLVKSVEFSSGGWQAKYGDKLSSVMNVAYNEPTQTKGSVTLGLLGGSLHTEGTALKDKLSYTIGVRRKQSQYLLNTLEVKGEYLPAFTDIQGYFRYVLGNKKTSSLAPKSEIGLLLSYGRNRYLTRPVSQETTFGTFSQQLRLYVAYAGQELLNYDLGQGGLKFTHRPSDKLTLNFIGSAMNTSEREFYDTESAYRLCEIDLDPNSPTYKQCIGTVGVGSEYKYARNQLNGRILSLEHRATYEMNPRNRFEWGIRYNRESFTDKLNQYSFADSADYAMFRDTLFTNLALSSNRWNGYLQHSYSKDNQHTLTYGARIGYWSVNKQWLISPSIQYAFTPNWVRETTLRFAAGIYRQPPLYRELRDQQGHLNLNLRAQSSLHLIAGMRQTIQMWGREFVFNSELYYKNLWDVVAYDVDNVRLRYYANNNTRAYAVGADFRFSGEFIKGAESWFSLGIMQTKEDLSFDQTGYIRRPTDQRVTLAVFFQDHLPGNPSWRVYLNTIVGTGLPFGPPKNLNYRSALHAPPYRRLDIGFSKIIAFGSTSKGIGKFGDSIWIGVELLNALGARNVMSYNWVTDVNERQYAVPNALSARFLNFRVIVRVKDPKK
ncbi:TonB-dependent receptor [Cytophagaceae bacterium YF14B1]|uniref:TonB-dependent receptor n=1 Tax=Xanthocytophaga flava TaxID=3048013 RepID=A0AAE3UBT1_9BACT|nr:TonB-dependent receptor [Xanthocytophaga flavus]MDJ1484084.1 TonB-dependent receptor [Xanthocytophaga flavus]